VFAALAEFIGELIVQGTNEGLDAARARGCATRLTGSDRAKARSASLRTVRRAPCGVRSPWLCPWTRQIWLRKPADSRADHGRKVNGDDPARGSRALPRSVGQHVAVEDAAAPAHHRDSIGESHALHARQRAADVSWFSHDTYRPARAAWTCAT
jgi:hypothetical protein